MTVVGGPLIAVRFTSRIRALIAVTRSRTRSSLSAAAIASRGTSTSRRMASAGGRNETPSSLSLRLPHHNASRGSSRSAIGLPLPARLSNSPRRCASWICLSIHDCHLTSGGLRSVTVSRLRLAAQLAEDAHVAPLPAAETGPTQHAFAREARLLERLLLGDVAGFGAGLDPLEERGVEEVGGELSLRLTAVALAAMFWHQPDPDVPAVAVGRRSVERPDPADITDDIAVVVDHGEGAAVIGDGLVGREAPGHRAGLSEAVPAQLAAVLGTGVLAVEHRHIRVGDRAEPDHARTL